MNYLMKCDTCEQRFWKNGISFAWNDWEKPQLEQLVS